MLLPRGPYGPDYENDLSRSVALSCSAGHCIRPLTVSGHGYGSPHPPENSELKVGSPVRIGKLATARCVPFHPTNDRRRPVTQAPTGLPRDEVLQEVHVVHAGLSTGHMPERRKPPKKARAEKIPAMAGHLIAYHQRGYRAGRSGSKHRQRRSA